MPKTRLSRYRDGVADVRGLDNHSDIVVHECRIYDSKMNLIRVIPEVRLAEFMDQPIPRKLTLKFGEKE